MPYKTCTVCGGNGWVYNNRCDACSGQGAIKLPDAPITPDPTDTRPTSGYAPGSFGCHEVFHLLSCLVEQFGNDVYEHPAISFNPDWHRKAADIHQQIFDLYQAIGKEHVIEEVPRW